MFYFKSDKFSKSTWMGKKKEEALILFLAFSSGTFHP